MTIEAWPDFPASAGTGDAAPDAASRERHETGEAQADYDVIVIGGGPAGLAAGALCGRKLLRTAVLDGGSWGGVLTRHCPDKRIDNYPGVRPGIRARELAASLVDDALRAGADLIGERADRIAHEAYREIRAPDWK